MLCSYFPISEETYETVEGNAKWQRKQKMPYTAGAGRTPRDVSGMSVHSIGKTTGLSHLHTHEHTYTLYTHTYHTCKHTYAYKTHTYTHIPTHRHTDTPHIHKYPHTHAYTAKGIYHKTGY